MLNALGVIPFFWYNLTGKRLAGIREQLALRRERMLAEKEDTEGEV